MRSSRRAAAGDGRRGSPPPTADRSGPATAHGLRLVDVTKRFGPVVANDRVSVDVRWGEVHALMGENGAGKTTLMRVAAGLYEPEEGYLEVDGARQRFRSPEGALRAGIGMVHQHFTLVPTLSGAENLALRPTRGPRRSHLQRQAAEAQALSQRLGLDVDLDRLVADMTISERQRLEILKLMYRGADVLIFDEPSAALTPTEWHDLAALMRRMATEGKAVVVITHKMHEVFSVADRYTVLRDGGLVGSGEIADVGREQLVEMMVGRSVALRPEREPYAPGPPVLALRDLRVLDAELGGTVRPLLDDLGLDVLGGEVLGLAGVSGNGQSELVEALLGLRPLASGTIEMAGERVEAPTPTAFARRGGGLIPEDRHSAAIADELTIWENLLMRDAVRAPFARRGVTQIGAARDRAAALMREYDVRADGVDQRIGQLSGGNQQKVVVARELSQDPQLVIAFQPTRGLDVRASEFVYERLLACRRRGAGVLLISMDLDEILALSDRVAVIASGRIAGVLDADEATSERIGMLMANEGVAA